MTAEEHENAGAGVGAGTAAPSDTAAAPLAAPTATPLKVAVLASKRGKALPPPVNDEEAERRKLFYAELRRHHRAFGLPENSRVVQETAAAERADEEAAASEQQDGDGANGTEDAEPHASELYMELMEDDFGPVEKDDPAFMRNFPRVFETWETFDETLERYTRGTFQIMRKHMTQTTVSRNKGTLKYLSTQMIPGTFIGSFYPERFEWYKKVLVCAICRATSAREKKLANRPAGNTLLNRDTDAKITAHLQPESEHSKHFVIDVTWSGAHNHRCDEDELAKFKHGASRLDDPVLLSLIQKMRKQKKDVRDVKRFIFECTGKKCSTKDVHAMYQRMNTSDNEVNGENDGEDDSGPDDTTFDFFSEHQTHVSGPGQSARMNNLVANSSTMEFDPMTGRLRSVSMPERSLAAVQQNIVRLAETLAPQEQAELANSLQSAMFAWTSKRKKSPNSNGGGVGVGLPSNIPSFQSPPPFLPNGGSLPSSFDYRRYDASSEGADLLMGLDATGAVFATAHGTGGGGTRNNTGTAQSRQKRRRQ